MHNVGFVITERIYFFFVFKLKVKFGAISILYNIISFESLKVAQKLCQKTGRYVDENRMKIL